MRFKAGLVVGLGAGYILGTRAGRQRYEQIIQAWDRFTGSPAVQRTAEKTKEVAGQQAKRTLHAVEHQVEKAGSAVKERLGMDTGADTIAESWPGPIEETVEVKAPSPPSKTGELGT